VDEAEAVRETEKAEEPTEAKTEEPETRTDQPAAKEEAEQGSILQNSISTISSKHFHLQKNNRYKIYLGIVDDNS
jgi:hypothetical protein